MFELLSFGIVIFMEKIYIETEKTEQMLLPPRALDLDRKLWTDKSYEFMRNWMKERGRLPLFDKLIENIRFISSDEVDKSLDFLSAEIAAFVDDSPYTLLFDLVDKSGGYLSGKINLKDCPPRQKLPIMWDEHKYDGKEHLPFKSGEKIVYLNDAVYSGHQDTMIIKDFLKDNSDVSPDNVGVFLIGATNIGKRYMAENVEVGKIVAKYFFPTISELFSGEEMQELREVFNWMGHYSQAVLTFFEHRVPDNFFGGLKKSMAEMNEDDLKKNPGVKIRRYFLIDDSKKSGPFSPPYW